MGTVLQNIAVVGTVVVGVVWVLDVVGVVGLVVSGRTVVVTETIYYV